MERSQPPCRLKKKVSTMQQEVATSLLYQKKNQQWNGVVITSLSCWKMCVNDTTGRWPPCCITPHLQPNLPTKDWSTKSQKACGDLLSLLAAAIAVVVICHLLIICCHCWELQLQPLPLLFSIAVGSCHCHHHQWIKMEIPKNESSHLFLEL